MNAKYTPSKVRELLDAQAALNAVPDGQDYVAERGRLTAAEDALLAEGWRNEESEEELRALAAE